MSGALRTRGGGTGWGWTGRWAPVSFSSNHENLCKCSLRKVKAQSLFENAPKNGFKYDEKGSKEIMSNGLP